MPPQRNLREIMAEKANAAKQGMVEAIAKRLGPPPRTDAARAQADDEYRLFWKPAKGWEDPAIAEQKALAMYAQGAQPADVLKAHYPDRVRLIPFGNRRDNIDAQVEWCNKMATRWVERNAPAPQEGG